MAINVASLKATLALDDSGYQRGLQDAERRLDQFADQAERKGEEAARGLSKGFDRAGDKLKSIGSTLTVGVTAPMLAAGAASVQLASNLEETLNKSQVVFGRNATAIATWARTAATSMGQTQQEALASAATFGNLLNTIGLTGDQSSQMSMALVQLSADLSSFHNIAAGDAFQKLQSGLAGETEPLRSLGVFLNEASVQAKAMQMGLADANGELSEGAKVQARYALIMEQTTAAQGDFARTKDSFANSLRTVTAQVKEESSALGKEFLPVAKDTLKIASDLLKTFNALPEPVKQTALQVGILTAALGPFLQGGGALLNGASALKNLLGGGAAAGGAASAGGAVSGGVRGALAAGRGALAGAGARFAGSAAGRLVMNPVTGAIVAGVGGAFGLNWLKDRMDGREDVGIGGTLYGLGLNPFYKPGVQNGVISQEEFQERRRKRAQPSTATGPLTASRGFSSEEMARIQDAQFRARLDGAQADIAGMDGEARARAELGRMLPILRERSQALQKRAAELRPVIGTNAKAAEEYWGLQSEISSVQERGEELKARLAREVANRERETAEKAKEAHEQAVRLAKQQAEEMKRRMEAAARERAAVQELTIRANETMIEASLSGANAGQRADVLIPRLRQQQAELAQRATKLTADSREYQEGKITFYQADQEIYRLQEAAQREQAEALQKARDEQAKLRDQQRQVGDLQMKLMEMKVQNDPFLSDSQRKQRMVSLQLEQYRRLMRPVQGETELQSYQRQIEAEQIRGGILQSMGGGSGARVAGGGYVGLGNRRALAGVYQQLAAIESQGTGKSGTTVYQVIVTGETPTERKQSVRKQLIELTKVM